MSFNCSDSCSHLDLEIWCHGFLSPSTTSSFPHSFYHHETPVPPVPQPCVSSRAMAREPARTSSGSSPGTSPRNSSWEVAWTPPPHADTFPHHCFSANGRIALRKPSRFFFLQIRSWLLLKHMCLFPCL